MACKFTPWGMKLSREITMVSNEGKIASKRGRASFTGTLMCLVIRDVQREVYFTRHRGCSDERLGNLFVGVESLDRD